MEKNKIQKNIKENQKKLCKINNKQRGITLIALVVTMIVPYDKMKECCNM